MSLVELKLPTIGESITEVTLSQWLKEEGDYVALDEPICEFESDKATLEFPAEVAGILKYVAAEGDEGRWGNDIDPLDLPAKLGAFEVDRVENSTRRGRRDHRVAEPLYLQFRSGETSEVSPDL